MFILLSQNRKCLPTSTWRQTFLPQSFPLQTCVWTQTIWTWSSPSANTFLNAIVHKQFLVNGGPPPDHRAGRWGPGVEVVNGAMLAWPGSSPTICHLELEFLSVSLIDKDGGILLTAKVLVSPILKNKGNLGYFLILPSQLINTWFTLKCKNITPHTLLIIRKYRFEVSLFLSYYPWQMFAREKLRGHFLASILAENGNHCAT